MLLRKLSITALLLIAINGFAAIDSYQFSTEQQQQDYRELVRQLRCPKCQNNNIVDSNAAIATDMRAKVYELLQAGNDKQQVVDYMVSRYGHFVSYDPPLTAGTVILWVAPLLFLLGGSSVVFLYAYRSKERVRSRLMRLQQRKQQQKEFKQS